MMQCVGQTGEINVTTIWLYISGDLGTTYIPVVLNPGVPSPII